MGVQLASDIPVHGYPTDDSDVLRLQIHKVITPFLGSEAPVLISEEGDLGNRDGEFQHHTFLRLEVGARLQVKDLGVQ